MNRKTLRDIDLSGKTVLMRVDFNVPLSKDGDILDETRIRAALPSIEHITGHGASVVLMSHLGRPKGKKDPSMSLGIVAHRLGELTESPVKFVEDCVGSAVREKFAGLKRGEILLLENLRFYNEETDNDTAFSKQLSEWGDIYANDAFGTAHRAHASTEGVTRFFERRVAGFLLERELEMLGGLLEDPESPFVAILGGAKISGKINLIRNLLDHVDRVIVGGGMAFTFLKAAGLEIGNSLVDDEYLQMCRELMKEDGKGEAKRIFLPVDCVVAEEIDGLSQSKTVSTGNIPENWYGVDIGEKTVALFASELKKAKTVFWNGPMGVFEIERFAAGTRKIAKDLAEITGEGAKTIVGGGDSVSAINQANLSDRITHISTGGGASLTLLEGGALPAVEALEPVQN